MLGGPGVVAARQAGAGFGGCLVALVETGEVDAFSQHVKAEYAQRSGLEARVYPVQASSGAGIVPPDDQHGGPLYLNSPEHLNTQHRRAVPILAQTALSTTSTGEGEV